MTKPTHLYTIFTEMMTHYYHFHQQNSPSSYHHRNKGSLIYLEQFQNHPIGIPKLMKMHLKTFEHPHTPCFREYPPRLACTLGDIKYVMSCPSLKWNKLYKVSQIVVMSYSNTIIKTGMYCMKATCKYYQTKNVLVHLNFVSACDSQNFTHTNIYSSYKALKEIVHNVKMLCFRKIDSFLQNSKFETPKHFWFYNESWIVPSTWDPTGLVQL